jgi:putative DNA primase/helicase
LRTPSGAPRQPQDSRADERTAAATALWAAAVDPRGTVVERYLNSRALVLDDGVAGDVIRWHPSAGCMLALFRHIHTNEARAVSRTFLDAEGGKLSRKFLGPVGGAAIKLDADHTVLGGLHLSEGIENAMTARQKNLKPAWAAGSAGAVAAFPVLNGVECLTLLAEHDEANARAVEQCAASWHAAGKEILINESVRGKDLNDALRGVA